MNLLASSCDFVEESLWRNYANPVAGPALRRANARQNAWIDDHRAAFNGDWHRREHGDLQSGGQTVAAKTAGQRARTTGAPVGGERKSAFQDERLFVAGLQGLPGSESGLQRSDRVRPALRGFGNRRGARTGLLRTRFGKLLQRA